MTSGARAAVVGVGHLGRHHARIYASMAGVDLVGVVDVDEGAGRKVAEEHGTRWFRDAAELPDVDLVSVATPTVSHHEVAGGFIDRGVSVLVEKPLTRDLAEGEDLVRRARDRGVVLQVGHVERFNPACTALDRLEIEPMYVECDRISPFSFRSSDIGVVLDLMIHDLDLVLHLVRHDVERVDAVGVSVLGLAEDIANARLTFANGCVANVTASRVSMKTERKLRLFAPECYASLDFGARRGSVYRRKRDAAEIGGEVAGTDPRTVTDPKALVFGNFIEAETLPMDDHEPLGKEIEAFVTAVRDGSRPVVSGEDALRALGVAHRVLEEIRRFGRRSEEFVAGRTDPA